MELEERMEHLHNEVTLGENFEAECFHDFTSTITMDDIFRELQSG